jgi:DNA repair protein RecN (Recombination protein N)
MLKRLELRGLALLSDVSIELSPGLNVFTGESGAGKSLVLAGLGLLLGRPASPALVRSGADALEVRAELDVSMLDADAVLELAPARAVIAVSRLVRARGRSLSFVDDRAVRIEQLAELLRRSVSVTGQGAAAAARGVAGAMLSLVDREAELDAELAAYARVYACLRELVAEKEALTRGVTLEGFSLERLEQLRAELSELAPSYGEHERLTARIELLGRAQHYLELSARIESALSGRENAIEDELRALAASVRRAPSLAAVGDELEAALAALSRAGQAVTRFASELDAAPDELERLEKRLSTLERLSKLLGCSPAELPQRGVELEQETERRRAREARRVELEAAFAATEAQGFSLAGELHRKRAEAIPAVEARVRRELDVLGLAGARLGLQLVELDALDARGASRLALGFSANPGEPERPLERVASGGERSRVLLAMACLGATRARTLSFDEIDQGVGGHALEALAERLQRLGRERQVLCITHQAVVAARADAHFLVEKVSENGRTTTRVKRLGAGARERELSRMLAFGAAAPGAQALARRLLSNAHRAA